MLDQVVEARAPATTVPMVSAFLGLGLLGSGVATSILPLSFLSFFPLSLALVLWLRRPKAKTLSFESDRIIDMDQKEALHYSSITALYLDGKTLDNASSQPSPGPIHAVFGDKVLYIPEEMSVDPVVLFEFLSSRRPPKVQKIVPSLQDHVQGEQQKFGKDKVTVVSQRISALKFRRAGKGVIITESMIISGLLCIVAAFCLESSIGLGERDDLVAFGLGLGFFCLLLGGLLRFLFATRSNRASKHRSKYGPACLVITPSGLAMDQGDLQGKLRWDEILELKDDASSSHVQREPRVLTLKLSGVEIQVIDLYEKPLSEIKALIIRNLGPSQS